MSWVGWVLFGILAICLIGVAVLAYMLGKQERF